MKNIWQKLKNRWEVKSNFQAATILFTFAITGITTIFVRTYIYSLVDFNPSQNLGYFLFSLVFITLPLYNFFLITWGTILGQNKFFKYFIVGQVKKILQLLTGKEKKEY